EKQLFIIPVNVNAADDLWRDSWRVCSGDTGAAPLHFFHRFASGNGVELRTDVARLDLMDLILRIWSDGHTNAGVDRRNNIFADHSLAASQREDESGEHTNTEAEFTN